MMATTMQIFKPIPILSSIECQICSSQIQGGFPSPADDVINRKLDLNTHLIKQLRAKRCNLDDR